MSTIRDVVGVRPPDEKWKQMKAIWDACKAAGVPAPVQVENFFHSPPDDAGAILEMKDLGDAVQGYTRGEYEYGFEVTLAKLPKDVTIIRFRNRL